MWRRKTTGVIVLAAGLVLFVGGIVDHALAAPKAALCQSGIGQIGQAIDGTVAHGCGLVTALESAVGWLLAVGVLAAICGAAILYNSRTPRTPRTPARPTVPVTPPVPAPPLMPRQANPVTPPAERPWWTQT